MFLRQHMNYWFGVLAAGLDSGQLAISSTALPSVPAIAAPTFLPVSIQDPSTGKFEVVWITAHTAGASTATISRGKEGTTAQSWVAGTLIGHTTLGRDLRIVDTNANIAAQAGDYAIGDEVVDSTNNVVHEMTSVGFQERVYANPSGMSPGFMGVPPGSMVPILKAFLASYSPNGSGNGTITWPGTPFPNGVCSVVAMPSNTTSTTTQLKVVSGSVTTTGCGIAAHTASGGVPTDVVSFSVLVVGY